MIQLTKKERQIVDELMEGNNSRAVGKKLGMSYRTVEVHRYNVLKKVPAAKNMIHLVVLLMRKGVIS